jgi:hypothetical protein
MSSSPGKQAPLTFQEIARRLPPDKLERLEEINKVYANIPLDLLPAIIKQEVQAILQSGLMPSRQDRCKPGR